MVPYPRLFVAERVIIFVWQVLDNQLHDLAYLLEPSYLHVGVGRNDGKTAGEAVPIFWRKWIYTRVKLKSTLTLTYLGSRDRLKLLSVQYFWLSDKPEVVGSIGWDAVGN